MLRGHSSGGAGNFPVSYNWKLGRADIPSNPFRRAESLIGLGVEQVIVGRAAFRQQRPNLSFLKRLAARVGKKHILIALDTAKGRIVIHGWQKSLSLAPAEVMSALEPYCADFLCTDVEREGTMRGVNYAWFRELRRSTQLRIVAAGGISTTREISALQKSAWTPPSAWPSTKTACAEPRLFAGSRHAFRLAH